MDQKYKVTYLGSDGTRKEFGKDFTFADAGTWATNLIKAGRSMIEVIEQGSITDIFGVSLDMSYDVRHQGREFI